MSDRELLEAAARAFWAGEIDDVVSIEWGTQDDCILYTHADNQDHNGHDRAFRWDPLEENHDAFELAVKLNLMIFPDDDPKGDRRYSLVECGITGKFGSVDWTDDPYAATRRAIVLCAAALAKDTP
jgi:hypothetical protein